MPGPSDGPKDASSETAEALAPCSKATLLYCSQPNSRNSCRELVYSISGELDASWSEFCAGWVLQSTVSLQIHRSSPGLRLCVSSQGGAKAGRHHRTRTRDFTDWRVEQGETRKKKKKAALACQT